MKNRVEGIGATGGFTNSRVSPATIWLLLHLLATKKQTPGTTIGAIAI